MKALTLVLICLYCELLNAQAPHEVKLTGLKDGGKVCVEFTYTEFGAIKEQKLERFFTEYNYNDKNQLTSADGYMDHSTVSAYASIAFAKKAGWTTPANTPRDYRLSYEYNDQGQLKKSSWKGYSMHHYDKMNRIDKIEWYADGKLHTMSKYTYDKRGNLIRKMTYKESPSGNPKLREDITYKYDDQHNPYFNFHLATEPGKYTNPNNIVSTKVEGQVMAVTYQYNSEGYPVSDNRGVEYLYE